MYGAREKIKNIFQNSELSWIFFNVKDIYNNMKNLVKNTYSNYFFCLKTDFFKGIYKKVIDLFNLWHINYQKQRKNYFFKRVFKHLPSRYKCEFTANARQKIHGQSFQNSNSWTGQEAYLQRLRKRGGEGGNSLEM